jgi:divalent metal cation (Fe/Co/Zn/Cd) transporter
LIKNETTHFTASRADDVRLALLLTYITIGWMTIEGAASLLLGWASKSLLLEAFGIDSVIELFSAAVLLWRLRVEASGAATFEHVNRIEHRAARLVGYSLFALVAYVLLNSGYGLFIAKRITDTNESVWGILIGAVAKVGMPILAGYKLKVAARLNSRALRADAVESITCGYLSIVLMIGLAATRLLDWWWLDSVAALARPQLTDVDRPVGVPRLSIHDYLVEHARYAVAIQRRYWSARRRWSSALDRWRIAGSVLIP